MRVVDRRKFIKDVAIKGAGFFAGVEGLGLLASPLKNKSTRNKFMANIPLPIQVVIDDVGWWSGHDGSKQQEPFRSGIDRNHVPADYTAITVLGKKLGIRPQAAMVLGEWDTNNILRKLPTATWMGKNWDNRKWIGPWMEEAAGIIRENERHFELTLHGIGHEYWTDGNFTRAEWADVNGRMRPRDQVEKHLDFFEKIMQQHGLGPFPNSFVPTAFNHGFGITPGHKVSMAEILSKRGIKYINTPFHQMYNAEAVKYKYFGFDADVLTIDRGHDVLPWDATGISPTGHITGPTCGMHWANLIHPDPARNLEVVKEWVDFLAPYDEKLDTMLAVDSEAFQSQLIYHRCVKIKQEENGVWFDFSALDNFPGDKVKNEFNLKVSGKEELVFASNSMEIQKEPKQHSKSNTLHVLKLKRKPKITKAFMTISGG